MKTFEEYFYGKNNVKGFLKHIGKDKSRSYDLTDYKDFFLNSLKKKEEPEKEQEDLPEVDINFVDDMMTFENFKSKFYHVTKLENIDKIKEEGLKRSITKTFSELTYPNHVYVSSTLMGAKMNLLDIAQYLKRDLKDLAVIEVEIPKDVELHDDKEMGNDSFSFNQDLDKKYILNIFKGDEFIRRS